MHVVAPRGSVRPLKQVGRLSACERVRRWGKESPVCSCRWLSRIFPSLRAKPDSQVLLYYAMANPITKIAVTGAGQMGLGIAYVAAVNARASVRLYDGNVKALDKGVAFFESLLAKDVKKNKMTQQQADEARGRLSIIKDLEALGDKPPEMVCEAIVENLGAKQDLFKRLANIVPVETILATNTSSISVSKIASAAVREKFQGGERDRESPARVRTSRGFETRH